jgi:hypothetical protein
MTKPAVNHPIFEKKRSRPVSRFSKNCSIEIKKIEIWIFFCKKLEALRRIVVKKKHHKNNDFLLVLKISEEE